MWRLQDSGAIFVCVVSVKLRLLFTAGPYWQVVWARCAVWIFIDLWNLRPQNACSLSFLRPALKICVKNADFCVNANPDIPAAELQSSLPSYKQIILIPTAQPSSKQTTLIPVAQLQSSLPSLRQIKILAVWMQNSLPSFKQFKPVPTGWFRPAFQVIDKSNSSGLSVPACHQ